MRNLLSDIHGEPSTTRLAAIACTGTACASVLSWSFLGGPQPDLMMLTALLGGGLGAKVVQRAHEERGRQP